MLVFTTNFILSVTVIIIYAQVVFTIHLLLRVNVMKYKVQNAVTEPWNSRLAIDKSVNSHVNLYLFKYENVCFLFDFFSVISKMTGIPFGTKLLFAPWKVLN